MIWLTWRQFRAQALTEAGGLAAFAILLVATGPHLANLYAASGITGCHGDACGNAASGFLAQLAATRLYPIVYALGILLIFTTPVIIGIFWGAPLIAREFETGTYRLAWNQSVTRTRWLTVKLALTGLAAVAVTEALSLMQAWWADPIDKATGLGAETSVFHGGSFSFWVFDTHGITPLGYAAFGFALGAAAGVLIRRAVPAMAVTLAIFAVVQVAMPLWVRPHLIPPDRTVATFESVQMVSLSNLAATAVPGQPGAWIISSGGINAAGQAVGAAPVSCLPSPAAGKPSSAEPLLRCLDSQGLREVITYQPANRYWPLQLIETGIYLALALALAGSCFRQLGRRS